MSIFVVSVTRIKRDENDIIIAVGVHQIIAIRSEPISAQEAYDMLDANFERSKFKTEGWTLIGEVAFSLLTKRIIDEHYHCCDDGAQQEGGDATKNKSHLTVVK